jgi:hypothetical protein
LGQGVGYHWGPVSGGNVGGAEIHGSDINPSSKSSRQGYVFADWDYVTFNSSLNVAYGIKSTNPLVVPVNSSLVSTQSRVFDTYKTFVEKAAILTILPSVPPENSFRPAYFGNDKTIKFNADNLNFSFLARLIPVTESYPGIPTLSVQNGFQRPWIRTSEGWTSRYIHPKDNMHDYYFYDTINDAVLVLNLNYTNDQKRKLLINFVQVGIDWYTSIEQGNGGYGPNGGIFNGFTALTIVSGHALNYRPMIDIFKKSGSYGYSGTHFPGNLPSDYINYQELDQTFYVGELNHNITHGKGPFTWTPSGMSITDPYLVNNGGCGDRYNISDFGLPEYGIRQSTNPGWSAKGWMFSKIIGA